MITKLVELRPYMLSENAEVYKMFQEMPEKEEYDETNEFFGLTLEETREKICQMMRKEYSVNEKNGDFPSVIYVFYVDNKAVGFAGMSLRYKRYINSYSATIWYKIRPTERNKGYGTLICKKLKKRCKDLDLTFIIASTGLDNFASRRILLKNGFTQTGEQAGTVFFRFDIKPLPERQKFHPKGKFY